jgi:hypothetical protein
MYTANIGKKDNLKEPKATFAGIEYVYFSDTKDDYESDIWDFRDAPRKFDTCVMDAKWYKMHPHLLFPGETTIWVDSLYVPMCRNPTVLSKLDDLVLWSHGERDCLYDEAALCSRNVTNRPHIEEQVAEYKAQQMPEHYGLFEANVLIRQPSLSLFNELWWEQIQKFSIRDQISLPYVLWKHNISYTVLPGLRKHKWFFKGGKHRIRKMQ